MAELSLCLWLCCVGVLVKWGTRLRDGGIRRSLLPPGGDRGSSSEAKVYWSPPRFTNHDSCLSTAPHTIYRWRSSTWHRASALGSSIGPPKSTSLGHPPSLTHLAALLTSQHSTGASTRTPPLYSTTASQCLVTVITLPQHHASATPSATSRLPTCKFVSCVRAWGTGRRVEGMYKLSQCPKRQRREGGGEASLVCKEEGRGARAS